LSLINLHPEEVVFASLSHIQLFYEFSRLTNRAEISIGALQVDNQLFGCQQPVALFAAPSAAMKSQSRSLTADRTDVRVVVRMEKDPEYGFLVFKVIIVLLCYIGILELLFYNTIRLFVTKK